MALADEAKRLEGLKDVEKKMRVAKDLGAPVVRINLGGPGKGIADAVGVDNCATPCWVAQMNLVKPGIGIS